MAYNGEIIRKSIPRELGLLFLRALFEQNNRTAQEHTEFIHSNFLLTKGMLTQEGHFVAMSPTKVDSDDETIVLCGLPKLVKKYLEIAKNKIYYSRTGYLKDSKVEEIRKVDSRLI